MQRTQRAIHYLAVILMLVGSSLPLAVDVGVKIWLKHLSQIDPVPNQGAMVLGFLGFVASVPIGVAIFGTGLSLFIWNISKRKKAAGNPFSAERPAR